MAGRSTLLLMPTGLGKSLTFQLPVLSAGKVALVISPLVALMRQHAAELTRMNIRALSLGGLDLLDAQQQLRGFGWDSGTGFIFVSPERTETDGYLEYLLRRHKARVGLVAIDEAHCISQWGHDFRPPYKAIPNFLDRAFGRGTWPTLIGLTATLSAASQTEVLADLRLHNDDLIRSDQMLRTNLSLSFQQHEDTQAKLEALSDLLDAHKGEKVIVYAHLKQNRAAGTRALATRFAELGHKCAAFDADMPLEERDRVLADFCSGAVSVVFATGAFGMGIDIPNIRSVIHFLLPESLEQYYQEVGRAGRDGKPAFGVLLYAPKNAKVRVDMIKTGQRTAEAVRSLWDDLIVSGQADLRALSPSSSFGDNKEDYALFYAFQRVGALEVVARGPGRIDAFAAGGANGAAFLQRLQAGSKLGRVPAAIRKLRLDPSATYDELFELYTRGEIRLERSPENVLLFRTRGLTDTEAQHIADEISARTSDRLAGFETFKQLVEATHDPTPALRKRFA